MPYPLFREEALKTILYGGSEQFEVDSKTLGVKRVYHIDYEGIANFIKNQYHQADSRSIKRWARDFMDKRTCPACNGSRLKTESLYYKIEDKEYSRFMSIGYL